ncbi:hypothetical protein V8F33_002382 [Rhypophila sp. PSN 637]
MAKSVQGGSTPDARMLKPQAATRYPCPSYSQDKGGAEENDSRKQQEWSFQTPRQPGSEAGFSTAQLVKPKPFHPLSAGGGGSQSLTTGVGTTSNLIHKAPVTTDVSKLAEDQDYPIIFAPFAKKDKCLINQDCVGEVEADSDWPDMPYNTQPKAVNGVEGNRSPPHRQPGTRWSTGHIGRTSRLYTVASCGPTTLATSPSYLPRLEGIRISVVTSHTDGCPPSKRRRPRAC